jgi:hypothetical protein
MLWDANVALWLACRWRRRAVSQGVIAACFVRLMRGLLQAGVGGEGLMGRVSVIVVAIMLGRFAMMKRGPLVVFGRVLVVLCALMNLDHDEPSVCGLRWQRRVVGDSRDKSCRLAKDTSRRPRNPGDERKRIAERAAPRDASRAQFLRLLPDPCANGTMFKWA